MSWLEKQIEDPVRFGRIKRGFYLFLVLVSIYHQQSSVQLVILRN